MASLRTAIKEWAGVIEALAQGKQILLIRKYKPKERSFLLYPTITYYRDTVKAPEKLDAKIQDPFRTMAREAAIKELEEADAVHMRYLFEVDGVINLPAENKIKKLLPFMIWTEEHVAGYAEKAKEGLYIWFGRTSKLQKEEVVWREVMAPPNFYKLAEALDVSGAAPVIPEEQYQAVKRELLKLGEPIDL